MSELAIGIENLGKRYRIGSAALPYATIRESIVNAATAPLRNLRRIRQLGTFGAESEADVFWALRDVSFEVKRGEVLGIVGRNGAGKSTLLKILSRITRPTRGRAVVRGRVGSLLEVGTGFHPELSGRDNIYLNGSILGMDRAYITERFDEIVDFAGVAKFIDTPVKRYSSGMYLRLAFAVAAHLETDILVVDEVLAVGDAEFQRKCVGKMGDVAKEGRTVLFVSHNMGAVSSLCESAILLAEGEVHAWGPVAETINLYLRMGEDRSSRIDLREHRNRTTRQRVLTSLELRPSGGDVLFGRPLTLRIGYEALEKVRTPQFVIIVHSAAGVRVFSAVSAYQESSLGGVLEGPGVVECRISSIPLLPGDYSVTVQLWQPGNKLDEVRSAAGFAVEWLDRPEHAVAWNNSLGVVYVDASWHQT
jgi:lipopolysaccharide transport system ATP-binding protein